MYFQCFTIVVQVLMTLPSIPSLMELRLFIKETWYTWIACSFRIGNVPARIPQMHSGLYSDHSSLWGSQSVSGQVKQIAVIYQHEMRETAYFSVAQSYWPKTQQKLATAWVVLKVGIWPGKRIVDLSLRKKFHNIHITVVLLMYN